jgi:hypothetical protein
VLEFKLLKEDVYGEWEVEILLIFGVILGSLLVRIKNSFSEGTIYSFKGLGAD